MMTSPAVIEKRNYLRDKALWYIEHGGFIQMPYIWGGDDFAGRDCSGQAVEILQAVGILEHGTDYTADSLYQKYKNYQVGVGYLGCLVFWFKKTWLGDEKAIHVEFMIDGNFSIGASGGGSKTKTVQDAIKDNAFTKMRPIDYRGMNYKICDPFLTVE